LDAHCSLVGESTEVATHRDRERGKKKEKRRKGKRR